MLTQAFVILLIHRDTLDELLPVFVVLECKAQDEREYRKHIQRISITMELTAYGKDPTNANTATHGNERSPSRSEDLIWTGSIESPPELIALTDSGEESGGKPSLAVWSTEVTISKSCLIYPQSALPNQLPRQTTNSLAVTCYRYQGYGDLAKSQRRNSPTERSHLAKWHSCFTKFARAP